MMYIHQTYASWLKFHERDKIPAKPFQKMVYYLILAIELNKLGHTTCSKFEKRVIMQEKSRYMIEAYRLCLKCNFRNVHVGVTYDRKLRFMCVMNFRFDKVRGVQRTRSPRGAVRVQRYNHLNVSLHIPLSHISGVNSIHTWSEEKSVKNNPRQKSIWVAGVLAKHYGLSHFF